MHALPSLVIFDTLENKLINSFLAFGEHRSRIAIFSAITRNITFLTFDWYLISILGSLHFRETRELSQINAKNIFAVAKSGLVETIPGYQSFRYFHHTRCADYTSYALHCSWSCDGVVMYRRTRNVRPAFSESKFVFPWHKVSYILWKWWQCFKKRGNESSFLKCYVFRYKTGWENIFLDYPPNIVSFCGIFLKCYHADRFSISDPVTQSWFVLTYLYFISYFVECYFLRSRRMCPCRL